MTARNITMRLGGLAAIAAGCGATLWLRAIMPNAPQDPTLLQAGLVVASFVLTLGGIVCLLNGGMPFGSRAGRRRSRRSASGEPVGPDSAAAEYGGEDRQILARLLARRAGRGIEG